MLHEPPDDIDRLLDRLEPIDPPAGFAAEVMARARQMDARPPRRWVFWAALDLLAALLLTATAFGLGRTLMLGSWATGHLLFDGDLALASPGDWLLALSEMTPLSAIVLLLAAGLVVAYCTHALLREAPRREIGTA